MILRCSRSWAGGSPRLPFLPGEQIIAKFLQPVFRNVESGGAEAEVPLA